MTRGGTLALVGLVAALGAPGVARAQSSAFTATLLVQPYPSPFVADWQRNPQMAVLTLLYSGTARADFRVLAVVTSATRGELARVISPPMTFLTGPVTQIITSADVLDWNTVSRNTQVTDAVLRTGVMPEGPLQVCAYVQTLAGVVLTQACADAAIVRPDPPQLIFPVNGGSTVGAQPVFQWTPVLAPPELGVSYRVRIVQLLQGQNPQTAIAANPTWYQGDLTGPPMLLYPLDGLPLDPAKQYVWQVQALDGTGQPLTKGGQSSEIWTFSVGGMGAPGTGIASLPDTLDLIPGVARLVGLKSADVQTTATDYVLSGPVSLEMTAPFQATLQVSAQDLDFDRNAIAGGVALVRAGTLSGRLTASAVPAALGGAALQFTEVDYDPTAGLTLKGQVSLPGAAGGAAVSLTGQAQVTAAGVYGTLTADAGSGAPLLALGQDPARLLVRQARVTLPGGSVSLAGSLELFGLDVGCGGVSATLAADGSFSANVACMPTTPVPLGAGGTRAQIVLRSVAGSFAVGAGASAPTYSLSVSSELRLDVGTAAALASGTAAGADCGGTMALTVANGTVSSSSFNARCDASASDADLGWLHARLSSLALQRFAYAPGQGFDFALTVDLAPWVPAISGLSLPAAASVTITPAGLGVPALDVAASGASFTLAGFGVKITHVRLPAFTLSWSDWSAASADGFKFSVDAEVSLASLPAGAPACLTAQPFIISNATIAGGRLKAHLDEHRFTPPCSLALGMRGSGATDTSGAGGGGASSGGSGGAPSGSGADASNPYQALQEPAVGNPPLLDSTLQWPADPAAAAALRQSQLGTIEAAETAYRNGLNDPSCDSACQRKLRLAYDSTQAAIWAGWRERDFGAQNARAIACLAATRQQVTAGQAAGGPSGGPCGSGDSLLNAWLPKLAPPKPPATADCANDLAYDLTVVQGAERQQQLMGEPDNAGFAQAVGSLVTYCRTQAIQQFLATCKTKPTLSLEQYDMTSIMSYERQSELMGIAQDTTTLPLDDATCPLRSGTTTGAAQTTRPPPDLALAPPTAGAGPFAPSPLFDSDADAAAPPPVRPVARGAAPVAADSAASSGITLQLDSIGGDLEVAFSPYLIIAQVPSIAGSIVLPPIFDCPDSTKRQVPLMSRLRFGPQGQLDGTIQGFLPSCPIDLAAVQVTVTDASLTFSTAGGAQSLVLAASATANFTLASSPVTGSGSVAIDLLHGRLLSGSLEFQGPFQMSLPRQPPVLSFTLQSAGLDSAGVHVDGRAQLAVPGGASIGATFDQLTINPQTLGISSGQVVFDAPFALEVGLAADGSLSWGVEPLGAALTVQTGVRVDLPVKVALGAGGLTASGSGAAHLVFGGRDVDSLVTAFSPDFALGFSPPGVSRGSVDFQRSGVSLGYIDASGFHPNLAYFAGEALPAKLPLPTADLAYLELRDSSGTLRVSTANTGNGIRIYTAPGVTVPLVLPALQLGRATAPRLLVTFDLTLDPLGENVSLGSISATVPADDADAFDLSTAGLPVALESVAYTRSAGGGYQWSLGGALRLFGQRQEPGAGDSLRLTVDGTGRITGAASLSTAQTIPLVPGSQAVVLTLQRVAGAFAGSLAARSFQFQLSATGGLALNLGAGQTYQMGATLAVSDQGVSVDSIAYQGADTARWLDLSAFRLGFRNLRVPQLSWSQTGGFSFQMLFDGLLRFPSLGIDSLPPIADISITNQGITVPAYSAPDLSLDLSPLGGFTAKLLAFRVGQFAWNWFGGQAPSVPGFGFDVELGFGSLMDGLPAALQSAKVRILNAGLTNGRLTGTIEPVTFATPIDLGIGKLTSLGGQLPSDGSAFALTAGFDLDLSAVFPVCNGAALRKTGNTLSIASNGWVSGTLSGVLPSCASNLGPFTVAFGQSDVSFSLAGSGASATRSIVASLAATVKFPGVNAGDTVSASGSLQFDVLQGKWLSGSIALTSPFKYQPADGNPYLTFTVQQASLDSGGLHFTGQAALDTKDGAQVTAQFNGFTLGLPDLKVKSGSVTFLSKFALGVGIANGALTWGAYSLTAARPSGPAFRAVVPDTITIDAQGLYVGGTATADLAYGDSVFGSLAVTFTGGFRVGFAPLAVTAGRASFVLGSDTIAHVDAGGFWPGNIFGVLPIPAKLGLPSADVAYLELRDAQNNLLIDMQTSPSGVELRTKAGSAVRLVVPALAASGQAPPAANVSFDVVVNPASLQFVSGAVTVKSDSGGAALFSLGQLGIPLDIRGISWDKVGGAAYGLTLAGRITLPASLDSLDVDVPNLTISASGLTGEIRLGSSGSGGGAATPLVSKSFLGDTLQVAVTGADLKFGGASGTSFALSGYLASALFSSGQGPAKVSWTGSVSPGGFTLSLDSTSGNVTLPLAVAQFQPTAVGSEPALAITADAQEFKVRMSGVLTVPTISPTLAVTIAGLQVGTKGVVFPTVSISGLDQQQFDLFGATFRLQDSVAGGTTVYPAIAVGVKQGAVALTLSGAVAFLGDTTRFYGLTVSTAGSVSIASASLLSQPLTLVSDVLTVDALTIQNNALRADLSVTLPEPLNSAGPQKVNFTIAPNGQITGGANLALINEQPSLTGSSTTHFQLGSLATIHLRYLGLDLDFANLRRNSAVEVVTDVYLQNADSNRIKLGDVVGNTVQPGLKIGFDGSVTWGNLALASQFTFDFDVVKLTVTNVSFPAQQSGFGIDLSGNLGLAVDEVSGSLGFKDFVVTSAGQIQFSPSGVTGGSFSVGDVVSLSVTGFGYSATPTTIQIKGGGIPASGASGSAGTPAAQTVSVLSYLTFGGSFEIDSVVGGGIDQFLVYRAADQSFHLLIQNAHLNVDDMVDFHADFQYDQNPNGFEIVAAGSGTIMGYGPAALVGAIERDGTVNRFGMFAKVDGLGINITPYLRLDGVGGGFFVRPRQQWLDMVRTAAGVSQSAGERVIAPPADAKFALMFYGDMAFLQGVISGRSLLTVTDEQLLMDGTVTILGQDGRLSGDHHLAIGLKTAYAEGSMDFTVNYGSVVNGGGPMSFFVYSDTAWGIYGTTQVTIIDFLKGSTDLFVGPTGFLADAKITASYNVAILTIDGTIDARVWKIAATGEWGGFTSLAVSASVLGGLASATGTLQGAVIIQNQPFIFAAADLKASVAGQTWDGWVWAKFQNGQVSGGLGADSSIIAAINEAQNVANEMTAAKDQTQAAITSVQNLGPPAVSLTTNELAAAYQNLQMYSGFAYAAAAGGMLGAETGYTAYTDSDSIKAFQGRYITALRMTGAPGDSAVVKALTDSVTSLFDAAESQRPQVQSRIAALGLSIQSLAADAANPPLPSGSPVTSASVAAPVTQDGAATSPPAVTGYCCAAGPVSTLTYRQATSGPGFTVDAAAAAARNAATQQASQLAASNDLAVRQQIASLEAGLATVRAATTTADSGSLPSLVGRYAAIASGAERQFAAQTDYLLLRRDWLAQQLTDLRSRSDAIAGPAGWIASKTNALVAAGQPSNKTGDLYNLVYTRLFILSALAGQPALLTQFQADYNGATSMAQRWSTLIKNADTSGVQLWYGVGDAGMSTAIAQAASAFDSLQARASQRLGTIRGAHATLSQSLAGLYQVQADAEGALYDLYDRYLASRESGAAAAAATRTLGAPVTSAGGKVLQPAIPSANDLLDTTLLAARRAQLAQDLTVPRLDGVQVTATSTSPYTAQLAVSWSAYHPSGVYEFEFLDADAGAATGAPLYSNGTSGTLVSYRFTPSIAAASTTSRTLSVGARGGAGFLGTGRTSYTLSFQPGGTAPPSIAGGTGLTADNTPPSTPVVTIPDLAQRVDSLGVNTAWTSDPTRIAAQWSADDPESGVSLFEYALWSTPTGTVSAKGGIGVGAAAGVLRGAPAPVVRDFTAVGGRTDATIGQAGLVPGYPYYVAVRATNGQGGVSATGVSIPLRYDPTPPVFATGAAIAPVFTVYPVLPATATATYAACPVPQPSLPGAPPLLTIAPPAIGAAWAGSLLAAPAATGAPAATPQVQLTRPDASDPESGVEAYYYDVSTEPGDTVYAPTWVSTSARSTALTVSGAPLDYASQFWVTLVAKNTAGALSRVLSYGPLRVADPTPPTLPVICAGDGAVAGQLAVRITTPATDPETQVAGYQYRVRTAPGALVRDWPTGVTADWPATVGANAVAAGTLTDGQSYLVDVRAINGQGEVSGFVTSGPVLYDVSPPPMPTASVTVTSGVPSLAVNATPDPHSGLAAVQWAVGTSQTSADVQPWVSSAVPAAGGAITLPFATTLPTSTTLWLQLRSVNGTGLVSTIYSASFTVPATPKLGLPVTLPATRLP